VGDGSRTIGSRPTTSSKASEEETKDGTVSPVER
jgi:hypothetical protein